MDYVLGHPEGTMELRVFISLDTLTKTQWEAAVRGWGLAWFWYDATMLVLCPDASTTTVAQELVKYL